MENTETRTYGGWRRKRGLGLFGLTGPETGAVLASGLLTIYSLAWFRVLLIPAAIIFFLSIAGVFRVEGLPFWSLAHREFVMFANKLLGRGRYLSPLVTSSTVSKSSHLPGMLAATTLYDVAPEGDDGPSYAIVWNRKLRTATVNFIVHSQTPYLSEEEQVDAWVASWHLFLADLGLVTQITHVAITVSTANLPGAVVADNVRKNRDPNAPELAQNVLNELIGRETQGTNVSQTMVSVTFDTNWGPNYQSKKPIERIEGVINLVNALERDLASCGLATLRPATSVELSASLRGGFTPNLRLELEDCVRQNNSEILKWERSGPTEANITRRYYEHDGHLTSGWILSDAPRALVTATILDRVLSPGPYPKRVTLIWEPTAASKAARVLEAERTKSQARALLRDRSRADETARDTRDREMTDQAAADEARGAGLGDFTIVASTTVPVPPGANAREKTKILEQANAELGSRAQQSRLLLREAVGFHDLILMAGLGAGINPATAHKALWR